MDEKSKRLCSKFRCRRRAQDRVAVSAGTPEVCGPDSLGGQGDRDIVYDRQSCVDERGTSSGHLTHA
jgi:hypothetical protein